MSSPSLRAPAEPAPPVEAALDGKSPTWPPRWLDRWRSCWTKWTTDTLLTTGWIGIPTGETRPGRATTAWWEEAGVSLAELRSTLATLQNLPDPVERAERLERMFPHPRPELDPAGRLRHFTKVWEGLGAHPFQVRQLSEGVRFNYETPPVQLDRFSRPYTLQGEEARQLRKQLDEMANMGATVDVTDEVRTLRRPDGSLPNHIVVHPVFIIDQGSKWRPIFDTRNTNAFMALESFKMLALPQVPDLIAPLNFMWGTDCANAYFLVPLSTEESWRHLLVVEIDGLRRYLRPRTLLFGQAPAPQVFTKLMRVPMEILRFNGITALDYIDDVNGGDRTESAALWGMLTSFRLLQLMGFLLKWSKSTVLPVPRLTFLGWTWDLAARLMELPLEKVTKLTGNVLQVKRRTQAPMRQVASLLGQMNHAAMGAPLVRALARPLQRSYREGLDRYRGYQPNRSIPITPEARERLEQLVEHLRSWRGKSLLLRDPTLTITADATPADGWGAHAWHPAEHREVRVKDRWTAELLHRYFPELGLSMLEKAIRSKWLGRLVPNNALEAIAQHQGLLRLEAEGIPMTDQMILFRSDNTTTVSYINKLGGRSALTSRVAESLALDLDSRRATGTSLHLPGLENRIADFDSRSNSRTDRYDYLLDRRLFRLADQTWGPHTIDLFATGVNAQTRRFCSRDGDPEAVAQDAFTIPWKGENAWLHPPPALIPRILRKLEREGGTATLVTPAWPTQTWWSQLLHMAVEEPRPVEDHQPDRRVFHPVSETRRPTTAMPTWNRTLVWRVSGDSTKASAFRQKLAVSSPDEHSKEERLGTSNGRTLHAGVVLGTTIPYGARWAW